MATPWASATKRANFIPTSSSVARHALPGPISGRNTSLSAERPSFSIQQHSHAINRKCSFDIVRRATAYLRLTVSAGSQLFGEIVGQTCDIGILPSHDKLRLATSGESRKPRVKATSHARIRGIATDNHTAHANQLSHLALDLCRRQLRNAVRIVRDCEQHALR